MALKQTKHRSKDRTACPRCGSEALLIDVSGKSIIWLTCPKCKFKKLMEREEPPIKITPLLKDETENIRVDIE